MTDKNRSPQCPACGSTDVSVHHDVQHLSLPYSNCISFNRETHRCNACGEEGDFYSVNDNELERVESIARRDSIERMLEFLAGKDLKMAYMERALDLPPRTMMRWKSGSCSNSSIALLRFIRTYPWLLGVAESKFDPLIAAKTAVHEGFQAFGQLLSANQVSAHLMAQSTTEVEVKFALVTETPSQTVDPALVQNQQPNAMMGRIRIASGK